MTEPLLELSVVELGTWLPVPTTGRLLQLLGARVTKIERAPVGDPLRARPNVFRRWNLVADEPPKERYYL